MSTIQIILFILSMAAIFAFAWYLKRGRKANVITDAKSPIDIEQRVKTIRNKNSSSSKGVKLWIEDGVSEVNVSAMAAGIDAGLSACFEKAECSGYTQAMKHTDYVFAIVKGVPDSQGNPAYKQPAAQYAGTEWDQGDGTVLVAGQMLTIGEPFGNLIVIPEHTQEQSCATIAEYEAEHVILGYNDGAKFEETKTHLGSGHPIIPACPGTPKALGFAQAKSRHYLFGDYKGKVNL